MDVAQLVRASDCDSEGRGFESRLPPHFFTCGPLAQLVEQETLNLLVVGSTPTRPTNFFNDLRHLALVKRSPPVKIPVKFAPHRQASLPAGQVWS